MKREDLRKILAKEITAIPKSKTFAQWKRFAIKPGRVICNKRGIGGKTYHLEIDSLENEKEYVHIAVAVCAPGWSCYFPLSSSFIVHRNGRIEK